MTSQTIHLIGDSQRQYAKRMIDAAPSRYIVRISEETRSERQNRLLWPLLTDVQSQVPEFQPFTLDDMKLRFMNALGSEMRMLPMLDGAGFFPVGQRSSLLSKSLFSDLIELIYMTGAKHSVVWRDQSNANYREVRGQDRRAA